MTKILQDIIDINNIILKTTRKWANVREKEIKHRFTKKIEKQLRAELKAQVYEDAILCAVRKLKKLKIKLKKEKKS